jgi:4-deoxy-L-threo-5-hexosulose-uronate ketol-isomerase
MSGHFRQTRRKNNVMEIRFAASQNETQRMNTQELRDSFLIEDLFATDAVSLVYWETDRAVVGSIVPTSRALRLETTPELASEFFCERRELGILNLGGPGSVSVDGVSCDLDALDALYVGRGSREIVFASSGSANPAKYYLLSYPAHAAFPSKLIRRGEARKIELGSRATANERTIYQYIHEEGVRSCQLVMGFTTLKEGSVWNTFPPHTHLRRSEVYLYFDLPEDAAVFHFMGPKEGTRHLVVRSGQAVLSPAWSIHSGCGTQAYSFVWGMGGENQRFADMDGIAVRELK